MFITDGQSGAGRLAAEWRCQADAAVHLATISAAVLGEQILTCEHGGNTFLSTGCNCRSIIGLFEATESMQLIRTTTYDEKQTLLFPKFKLKCKTYNAHFIPTYAEMQPTGANFINSK